MNHTLQDKAMRGLSFYYAITTLPQARMGVICNLLSVPERTLYATKKQLMENYLVEVARVGGRQSGRYVISSHGILDKGLVRQHLVRQSPEIVARIDRAASMQTSDDFITEVASAVAA